MQQIKVGVNEGSSLFEEEEEAAEGEEASPPWNQPYQAEPTQSLLTLLCGASMARVYVYRLLSLATRLRVSVPSIGHVCVCCSSPALTYLPRECSMHIWRSPSSPSEILGTDLV